jgi:hypothetical protein
MPNPTEFTLDDFNTALDDSEENCVLTLTGEDGEKVVVTIEREIAEELVNEMAQVLDLDMPEQDED